MGELVGEFLGAMFMMAILAAAAYFSTRAPSDSNMHPDNKVKTVKCPRCGSPAQLKGKRWECGWCGDFGDIGSL